MKKITSESFLEVDPTSALLSNQVDPNGAVTEMTSKNWAELILRSTLNNTVPGDVRSLFETARGAMVYGYYFYPLYTLGCEQLYRVAEAVAKAKCEALGAPKNRIKTFDLQIKFLSDKGIISTQDLQIWDSFRRMRNSSSHPKMQNIYSPGMFIPIMEDIAERINTLFR